MIVDGDLSSFESFEDKCELSSIKTSFPSYITHLISFCSLFIFQLQFFGKQPCNDHIRCLMWIKDDVTHCAVFGLRQSYLHQLKVCVCVSVCDVRNFVFRDVFYLPSVERHFTVSVHICEDIVRWFKCGQTGFIWALNIHHASLPAQHLQYSPVLTTITHKQTQQLSHILHVIILMLVYC